LFFIGFGTDEDYFAGFVCGRIRVGGRTGGVGTSWQISSSGWFVFKVGSIVVGRIKCRGVVGSWIKRGQVTGGLDLVSWFIFGLGGRRAD
jgi:hypothetical protein